jgi:hypothetical protein
VLIGLGFGTGGGSQDDDDDAAYECRIAVAVGFRLEMSWCG